MSVYDDFCCCCCYCRTTFNAIVILLASKFSIQFDERIDDMYKCLFVLFVYILCYFKNRQWKCSIVLHSNPLTFKSHNKCLFAMLSFFFCFIPVERCFVSIFGAMDFLFVFVFPRQQHNKMCVRQRIVSIWA